tara:strand:- start:1531 stop:1797 length:267 start_codon:yes stop_codon:yes gene_type:complete
LCHLSYCFIYIRASEGKSSKRSGKKSKKNQKKQKKKENKKQMYDTIVYTYLLGTCQFLNLFEQEQEKDSLQRYYNLEKKKTKNRRKNK